MFNINIDTQALMPKLTEFTHSLQAISVSLAQISQELKEIKQIIKEK
jgi:chaperonin cofactor prefoldin